VPKPRVVHTITRLIRGGAQLTVLGTCEALRDEFDIHVVCGPDLGSEGSIREEVERVAPVTVVPELRRNIHPAQDILAIRRLRALYEQLDPAVIHSHSSKAGIVSRFASRSRAGIVHTVHGWGHTPTDSPLRRNAFVALERAAAHSTNALVAVSSDVRNEGLARGIGKPSQYRLIPEDVDYTPRETDFDIARLRAREALGLDPDELVIGWVGRFVAQKDPEALARTLTGLLRSDDKGTRAVLVGDGPLRARTEAALAGLGPRVMFTGLRDDARDLYAAFDVVLHCSRWEGQPRVVQEALAERIPVVATAAAGVRDLVTEGVLGHVVEVGDVAALEARTAEVLADPKRRAPLDQSAIDELSRRNGHLVARALHAELYRELIGTGRAQSAA
jgi:glycosyltransferase involved in cell wall biosynthesis